MWLTGGETGRIHIGEGTFLNMGVQVAAVDLVEIGAHCMFANGSFVTDGNHRFDDPTKPITWQGFSTKGPTRVGDNVWCGANVVITSGATIGDRCVIGANSVVTESLPPNTIAAGAPARAIREITFTTPGASDARNPCAEVSPAQPLPPELARYLNDKRVAAPGPSPRLVNYLVVMKTIPSTQRPMNAAKKRSAMTPQPAEAPWRPSRRASPAWITPLRHSEKHRATAMPAPGKTRISSPIWLMSVAAITLHLDLRLLPTPASASGSRPAAMPASDRFWRLFTARRRRWPAAGVMQQTVTTSGPPAPWPKIEMTP